MFLACVCDRAPTRRSTVCQSCSESVAPSDKVNLPNEWSGIPEVSLRELMDMAIPQRNHPKPGYLITPLLDVRCIGAEGFWSGVSRLTESDLGNQCNEQWRKRLARLSQSSRIVGVQRTWSTPCAPPPWLLRLKNGMADTGTAISPDENGIDRASGS